nr:hypothetical protein BaRGS_000603 [Batillaria attramentaria]
MTDMRGDVQQKAKRTTYRSFCCKKILIHQENLEQLRIKLGDPCQTFYLDTLPVDDQQNTQRLPWVAVERFSNLALHTIESEVYAVGTTIWEMMTGKDPIREIPPLSPVPAEGSSQRISGEESVSTYFAELADRAKEEDPEWQGQFGVVLRGELSVACETRQAQRAQSRQSNMSSPFLLVMEFADLGSLESYVKKNKHKLGMQDFQKILCSMGKDVSEGMEFLSQRKLTHGDLAARNILLFTNPHRTGTPVAKVSDFGLAHWLKGGARGYYKRDNDLPFPAYWMALEVLEEDRYNSMTDVWSFGTVLWEMFSGDDPATAMNTAHLPEQEIVDALKRKYRAEERLPKPMYCPTQVYNLMRLCWHIDLR